MLRQALVNMSHFLLSDDWEFVFEVFGFDSTADRRGVVIKALQDNGVEHLRQLVTTADARRWEQDDRLLTEEVAFLNDAAETVRVASRHV